MGPIDIFLCKGVIRPLPWRGHTWTEHTIMEKAETNGTRVPRYVRMSAPVLALSDGLTMEKLLFSSIPILKVIIRAAMKKSTVDTTF